jgi:hypothetical protein
VVKRLARALRPQPQPLPESLKDRLSAFLSSKVPYACPFMLPEPLCLQINPIMVELNSTVLHLATSMVP